MKNRRDQKIPYYNFICQQCGHKFEVKTTVSEKDQVVCPACAAEKPRQVFSAVGLVKKSSGGGDMPASCDGCQNRPFG